MEDLTRSPACLQWANPNDNAAKRLIFLTFSAPLVFPSPNLSEFH